MHTQKCQYEKQKGAIVCSGPVQIDLESASDFEQAGKSSNLAPQVVHVATVGLDFNNASGDARTDQPVTFTFPNGSGNAVGALYNSSEGTLRLLRDVRLDLTPALSTKQGAPLKNAPPREVRVDGTSLDFGRDARILHIAGPAEAQSDAARLTAGELTLELDAAFRAHRLLAEAGQGGKPPQLTSQRGSDAMALDAGKLIAQFAPEGWVERVEGAGSVRGSRHGKVEDDEFHSDFASLEMWPRVNQAKVLNLSGGVLLKTLTSKAGDSRLLQTGALRMEFGEGADGRAGKPTSAETLTAGTMEWTETSSQKGASPTRTKLQGDKLTLAFGPEGKPKELDAAGNVRTERAVDGHPLQIATAKSGQAQVLPTGGWSRLDLQDDVKLNEGERSAQASHATFEHAAQTAQLNDNALVRDATTETHAPRILFYSLTGDIRAEGGVRSTDFSPNGGAQLAQVPANITSESMQGNSKAGRAVYSGHARLWQADSVLEADSLELLRPSKILNATGNVRAVFPQSPASQQRPLVAQDALQKNVLEVSNAQAGNSAQGNTRKPVLWHVTAGKLAYSEMSNSAHLEKNVVVQSPEERIRAPQMDLYFTRGTQTTQQATSASANPAGPQQISRAVGSGGVIVDQGTRRATAERGEYTAADGKFVMTGGNPTLYDGTEGTTTGRQLTFFLADDTIIVDSENGSRTLTKHRVNK
jgi:lipopolysaccharide export system protein LptA